MRIKKKKPGDIFCYGNRDKCILKGNLVKIV